MIAIGLGAMATVMWMTGRFGWSLQEVTADRWASACLHLLDDAAGASLVAASGVMLNLVGVAYAADGSDRSALRVSPRCVLHCIRLRVHVPRALRSWRMTKNIVAWAKGANSIGNVRRALAERSPNRIASCFCAEAHHAAKQREGSLQFVPDGQAAGIAAWFDTSIERVQRALVITTSCIGQLIKVACIFFGFSFSVTIARSTWQQEPKVRLVRRALAMAPLGQLGDNSFILSHSN